MQSSLKKYKSFFILTVIFSLYHLRWYLRSQMLGNYKLAQTQVSIQSLVIRRLPHPLNLCISTCYCPLVLPCSLPLTQWNPWWQGNHYIHQHIYRAVQSLVQVGPQYVYYMRCPYPVSWQYISQLILPKPTLTQALIQSSQSLERAPRTYKKWIIT